MKKKKSVFNKTIVKPTTEEKVKEIVPVIEEPVVEEVKPVIEKKIVNAVSVVVLNNDTVDAKRLLEKLEFQKKNYYPETEIIVVDEEGKDLLDLTKGQFIIYLDKAQDIKKDFLHQLYVNMRGGKEEYLINDKRCVNRNTLK